MESISSENLPVVWHTLNKIELAISRLQERTVAIHNVDGCRGRYGVIAKEIEPLKASIAYFKEHIDNC